MKKEITHYSRVYLRLVLAMSIWGGTFVPARILSQEFSAVTISFYRFLIASIFLLIVLVHRKQHHLQLSFQNISLMSILGLSGIFAYNIFFFLGVQTVAAGKASVIISINPAITALFASLFLKEIMGWKKLVGVFLALFGVITVISQGDYNSILNGGFDIGEAYLIGCVFSWLVYTVVGKKALKKFNSLQATTWACVFGTIFLFPFAIYDGIQIFPYHASFTQWSYLLYLGVFGSALAFMWFYEGVKYLGAGKAASFINISPMVGLITGFLFLNETIDLSLLIGGVIVLSGVFLINKE